MYRILKNIDPLYMYLIYYHYILNDLKIFVIYLSTYIP